MQVVIIIGIFLAVVGVGWYLARWFEEQRAAEYTAVARKLGLEFFPNGDHLLKASDGKFSMFLGNFSLFQLGHARKLRNLIRGRTEQVDVAIFDYSYTTGGGNSSSTHRQTVIRFDSPLLNLPRFELRPAHVGLRLAKLFGYQAIAIPEFPAFTKKYLLRGDDEEAIRELFTDDVVRHLESLEGLHIAGERAKLVIYRPSRQLKGYEIRGALEEAFGVFAQFKNVNPSEVP